MDVEHSWRHTMVTTLLCHFCLSEVDARHASGLFTIQGDPEDLPSRLGRMFLVAAMKNNGLPAYPNVCSSFSTIPGFLTLLKTYNTALLNATSFPELTAICVATLYYTRKYMTFLILTAI